VSGSFFRELAVPVRTGVLSGAAWLDLEDVVAADAEPDDDVDAEDDFGAAAGDGFFEKKENRLFCLDGGVLLDFAMVTVSSGGQ